MATSILEEEISPSEQPAATSASYTDKPLPSNKSEIAAIKPKSSNADKRSTVDCKVFLPDGETVSVDVDRKVKGIDLIERIHTDAGVYEKDYFSVYYIANNQKIFLDLHKPVKDQVPSEMKNEWRLRYGVKFYVSDPSMLKEDVSRYNYCLELCKDIKDNRVLVDRETSFRLTGLMLQASLGDFDQTQHGKGYINNFKEFILLPKDELPDDYEEQITEVHKAKLGYSPGQAESEFLQICKKLPRYGMHLFGAKDQAGTLLLIGLSYRGVSIYDDHMETAKYPWPNINKISYKRHKFIIRYRPSSSTADLSSNSSGAMGSKKSGDIQVIKFVTGNPPQSKRIWKCAVEQHTFFRLQVPDRPSRIQQVFQRGTKFRYSGRTFKQVQADEKVREEPPFVRSQSLRLQSNSKKINYVPARNSFRAKKVQREFGPNIEKDVVKNWYMLDAPPDTLPVKEGNFEEQQVQVKFRLKEAIPNTSHKFVIVKRNNKYEMDYCGNQNDSQKNTDPTFCLKPVNPKSTSSTTRVSVRLDRKPVSVAPKGTPSANAVPIYDSSHIPDVKLSQSGSHDQNIEDIVATRTVHSNDKLPPSTGILKRQYEDGAPLEFNAPNEEQHQATQLRQFLHREEMIMGNAIKALEQEGGTDEN